MKQLLRWSRNTWRSDITCLFIERAVWRNNTFTAIVMFDKIVTPFFLLYGMFFIPVSAILRRDYVMFVGWLAWLVFSRILRLAYYFVKHPWHVIFIPFFIVFQYLQAIVRIWALFTLYERGWGTRNITLKGNTIERDDIDKKQTNVVDVKAEDGEASFEDVSLEQPIEPHTSTEEKRNNFYKKKLEKL
jgi:cellulose synthase/poly-beta-1,6-N-acetylglucosamine synthase-like glycosyltransferase